MATREALDTDRAAQLFHALSDKTRLEILDCLRTCERGVCELTDHLDAAQSRLSFHQVLAEAFRVLKPGVSSGTDHGPLGDGRPRGSCGPSARRRAFAGTLRVLHVG